jgi:hypothetical protein
MRWALLVAAVILAVAVVGSLLYWLADGRPGTADDFRERVSRTGLNVAWSSAGPRGGSGLVDTRCGPVDVAIDEIDGQLWMRWAANRELLTNRTIEDLLSCSR